VPSHLAPPAGALEVEPDEAAGPRFLFVGRLVERKRPRAALAAFESVRREIANATLTFVGDGPLFEALRARAGNGVTLRGRLEGDELMQAYLAADILVVPSVQEVWGLVVNEGLAHGLAVVATDEVASALDLVDEASGAIVRADDSAALRNAMLAQAIALDRSSAARARRVARVSDCTPERFANDIACAAELALSNAAQAA
jgi:glycosyltransferase involved in cell wall biosynthesis